MRSISKIYFILTCIAFSVICPAFADAPSESCNTVAKEVIQETKVATADAWANMRGHEGSIKLESRRMLDQAQKQIEKVDKPADLCPNNCKTDEKPQIIFRSIPKKFLAKYDDIEKCNQLFAKTKEAPLRFGSRSFDTMDDLNDWIGEFSQGSGKDGKDLYRQCDGDCSPQYKYFIYNTGKKLAVDAEVVCGPARDKSDNNYEISIGNRWACHMS